MSATASTGSLSPEERQYYLATAMMSTAFEYGRDDTETWWLAFLPSFVRRMLCASFLAYLSLCRSPG